MNCNVVFILSSAIGALLLQVTLCQAQDDESVEKGCSNPADIVFVLDESGSIWGPHFTKQLEFVESVVDAFDVNHGKTHIGLMTFGNTARIIFHLGQLQTSRELKAAIRGVKQMRGETMTHDAISLMRTGLFSEQYVRNDVPHIAILITDGESNYPDRTANEARRAHDEGIQMFAIGVGSSVNVDELKAIATSDDYVFTVDDYEKGLQGLRTLLAWKACEVTTVAPPTTTTTMPQMIEGCIGHKPMDHIWSIPDGASREENDLALNLIRDVTSQMKLSPIQVQVGLSPRQCVNGAAIRLREHDTLEGFTEALNRRRYSTIALTHQHLLYMRNQGMTEASGSRPDAVKFGLLIVDSSHGKNLKRAITEARAAREAGIKLIVIGVGDDVVESELQQISSTPQNVITVSSYEELRSVKQNVIDKLCQGLVESSAQRNFLKAKRYFMIFEEDQKK